MNAATLTGVGRLGLSGLAAAARAACRRVTVQVGAVTLALAVVLEVWTVFDCVVDGREVTGIGPFPSAEELVSAAIINLLMAFTVMFTTLIADEMVTRGAARMRAYALAVVAGCAAADVTQWGVHAWLHLPICLDCQSIPQDVVIMEPLMAFFEYLIWATIAVLIYVNRRTALAASNRMKTAQVQQARARRGTLESRLQALQARVEPQFLFSTLDRVGKLYERSPDEGGRLLEELIVYLRAALPQLRESTSTLEREFNLVTAYATIMKTHTGDRVTFSIQAPEPRAVSEARFPPMILLPLLACVMDGNAAWSAHSERTIRVAASIDSSHLRVDLSVEGGRPSDVRFRSVLGDIDNRLRALYGDRAGVDQRSTNYAHSCAIIKIPHEQADGDHR